MASSLNHLQMVVPLTVAMRPERRTCAPSSARLHRDRGSPSLGEVVCDLVIGEARTPSPCPLTRNVPISLGADRADPSPPLLTATEYLACVRGRLVEDARASARS